MLLVDDDQTVIAVGKQMLETLGFRVLTAVDGTEALEMFRIHLHEIVCIILDLTMPHLGGEETFRELRKLSAVIPVIMSSGYNEQDVTQRFAGKGLAGFVQKPYTLDALQAALKKSLSPERK